MELLEGYLSASPGVPSVDELSRSNVVGGVLPSDSPLSWAPAAAGAYRKGSFSK